ncbi:MAG: tetratricopeptide repeat protein, partial [Alphaproteobacteria bacterium]|nr:tetratricopeptide repeat protein [Alphaproteobacteria bacterium]
AAYRQAILRDPHDLMAHQTLNELLYRLDRSDFLRSYDDAMTIVPDSTFLPAEKAKFLFMAERFDDARAHFERALALRSDNLAAKGGLASTLMRLGTYGEAIQGFEEVLDALPDNIEVRCSLAECFARAGDATRALDEARKARTLSPDNQAALALEGVALRQLDDGREAALNDYERLIRVFDLEPPEGYSDMESFNSDLEAYLAKLHLDTQEHINQTCRKGTKTLGTLFGTGHTLVDRLKARIDDAVRDYIRELDASTDHPLHRRKSEAFRYWGSWSIRLGDGGFHTNHVHPRGWISSAYYVALPASMQAGTGDEGALKFGEPSFDAGFSDPIRRIVTPRPGRLVLFPSYFWHGTIAFHGQDTRTTIAFDAIPADAGASDGIFVEQS